MKSNGLVSASLLSMRRFAPPRNSTTWYGGGREPACNPPHPTCYLTFQHPCTGQAIALPLRLPIDSTPRIEHRYNRLIYNYGSDSVEIEFLSDGSADVIYNSGLRRSPYR